MNNLAVINQAGEVWARTISRDSVGAGFKLTGPGLFGGPDDEFVLGSINNIAVVTKSGQVWNHSITGPNTIAGGVSLQGSLFGGPNTVSVLVGGSNFYVINRAGEVWTHWQTPGIKLTGPSLFGGPDYKYLLFGFGRDPKSAGSILVITNEGKVWGHDVFCSSGEGFCVNPDTVGGGHQLNGPSLFGGPGDKYAIWDDTAGPRILIINTLGQVWAHNISGSAIGPGTKLNGPGLFGAPNDKYVVEYSYEPTQ